MVIRTNTARVEQAVRYAMEFLLLHHPIDCPVCDQSGECFLQDYYMEHAGHTSRYPGTQKTHRAKAVDLGPLVKLDRERCILCTRCDEDRGDWRVQPGACVGNCHPWWKDL
jgi:NADH-quinone oxidoreductase subunit G